MKEVYSIFGIDAANASDFFFDDVLGNRLVPRIAALLREYHHKDESGTSASVIKAALDASLDNKVPSIARIIYDFIAQEQLSKPEHTELRALRQAGSALKLLTKYKRVENIAREGAKTDEEHRLVD
jgi:hypothetical protein